MAGYFITTNERKFDELNKRISNDFPKFKIKKGVGKKRWNIVYFQKINIDVDNICSEGNNFIIGVGTYIYKGKIGVPALELLLRDYKTDPLVVKNVLGHFNFVLYYEGELKIITDKSGHYFSYSSVENSEVVYSTSLVTLAEYLDDVNYRKQELLEFINVAASFGGKTIFNTIEHLESGKIIDLDSKMKTTFYTIEIGKTNFDEFLKRVKDYFSNFPSLDLTIGADLSGGFDTRTVVAGLLDSGTSFNFLTNDRPAHVSNDKKTATDIAKKFRKPIHVISLEDNYENVHLTDIDIVKNLESARGVDISKRVFNEIKNKSKEHQLIIGGWGAEMLRNQHGRFTSVKSLVKGFGYNRIKLDKREHKEYLNNLEAKLNHLYEIKNKGKASISELAFYLEKGKYWAGSVLSVRNKYAFWIFPFFDPEISLPLLGLKNKGNNLQNKVAIELCSKFEAIPYGNIDTESTFISTLKQYLKKVVPYKKRKRKTTYDYPLDSDFKKYSTLGEIVELDQEYLVNNGASRSVSKYETVGLLLKYLNEIKKVEG